MTLTCGVSLPHSTCTSSPFQLSLYLSLVVVQSLLMYPVILLLSFYDVPLCLPVPYIAMILIKTSPIAHSACCLMHLGPPSLLQSDTMSSRNSQLLQVKAYSNVIKKI